MLVLMGPFLHILDRRSIWRSSMGALGKLGWEDDLALSYVAIRSLASPAKIVGSCPGK